MDKLHDWGPIKADFFANKYSSLKDLAIAHGISYNYLRKRTAKWKSEKGLVNELAKQSKPKAQNITNAQFKSDTDTSVLHDIPNIVPECDIPEDRHLWHYRLWDKLGTIIEQALDNPDFNFFTDDGRIKTKAVSDIAMVIEKIQKGQTGEKDDKITGQLLSYVEAIRLARKSQDSDVNGEEPC